METADQFKGLHEVASEAIGHLIETDPDMQAKILAIEGLTAATRAAAPSYNVAPHEASRRLREALEIYHS